MQALANQNEAAQVRKRGRPVRDMEPILATAIEIFAREGFAAATIELIAAEAHVSSATLYKRFINKQGLFEAVLGAMTMRSLAMHSNHRKIRSNPFSGILGRLEAHCLVSADPQVRGVMRAWISEVSHHGEFGELFARRSGVELVEGLNRQMTKLEEKGLLDFGEDRVTAMLLAGQVMLGIVERFTLMRGLIMGDDAAPLRPVEHLAYLAVQAVLGIWGTAEGKAAFAEIELPRLALAQC
jgi:TetR/AcrR family transcriptional regulator, mexJK operon transcriptional repressor